MQYLVDFLKVCEHLSSDIQSLMPLQFPLCDTASEVDVFFCLLFSSNFSLLSVELITFLI